MLQPVDVPENSPPAAPSLRVNVSWTLAGSTCFMASRFLMLVLVARLFDKQSVGVYALAMSICSPLFEGAKLNLRAVQATDARGETSFGSCLALRIVMTLGALVAVAAVCLADAMPWPKAAVVFGVALIFTADMTLDVIFGLMQRNEFMRRVGTSQMTQAAVRPAALAAAAIASGSLALSVLATAATAWFVIAASDAQSLRRSARDAKESARPDWSLGPLTRLFAVAGPLGLTAFLDQSVMHAPRWMIERFLGDEELGAYGACSLFMIAGAVVVIAMSDAVRPRLARYFAQDRRRFLRLLGGMLGASAALGVAGVLVALVFGSTLLGLIFGAEYAADARLLFWMSVAAAVWYLSMTVHVAVLAARRFVVQLPVSLLAAATSLFASWHWAPAYGAEGAAWACAAGFGVRMVGACALLAWTINRTPEEPHHA